jgi:hypothetical protein
MTTQVTLNETELKEGFIIARYAGSKAIYIGGLQIEGVNVPQILFKCYDFTTHPNAIQHNHVYIVVDKPVYAHYCNSVSGITLKLTVKNSRRPTDTLEHTYILTINQHTASDYPNISASKLPQVTIPTGMTVESYGLKQDTDYNSADLRIHDYQELLAESDINTIKLSRFTDSIANKVPVIWLLRTYHADETVPDNIYIGPIGPNSGFDDIEYYGSTYKRYIDTLGISEILGSSEITFQYKYTGSTYQKTPNKYILEIRCISITRGTGTTEDRIANTLLDGNATAGIKNIVIYDTTPPQLSKIADFQQTIFQPPNLPEVLDCSIKEDQLYNTDASTRVLIGRFWIYFHTRKAPIDVVIAWNSGLDINQYLYGVNKEVSSSDGEQHYYELEIKKPIYYHSLPGGYCIITLTFKDKYNQVLDYIINLTILLCDPHLIENPDTATTIDDNNTSRVFNIKSDKPVKWSIVSDYNGVDYAAITSFDKNMLYTIYQLDYHDLLNGQFTVTITYQSYNYYNNTEGTIYSHTNTITVLDKTPPSNVEFQNEQGVELTVPIEFPIESTNIIIGYIITTGAGYKNPLVDGGFPKVANKNPGELLNLTGSSISSAFPPEYTFILQSIGDTSLGKKYSIVKSSGPPIEYDNTNEAANRYNMVMKLSDMFGNKSDHSVVVVVSPGLEIDYTTFRKGEYDLGDYVYYFKNRASGVLGYIYMTRDNVTATWVELESSNNITGIVPVNPTQGVSLKVTCDHLTSTTDTFVIDITFKRENVILEQQFTFINDDSNEIDNVANMMVVFNQYLNKQKGTPRFKASSRGGGHTTSHREYLNNKLDSMFDENLITDINSLYDDATIFLQPTPNINSPPLNITPITQSYSTIILKMNEYNENVKITR